MNIEHIIHNRNVWTSDFSLAVFLKWSKIKSANCLILGIILQGKI